MHDIPFAVFSDVVGVLVTTGGDINKRNVRSRTALHTAVWNRRPRLVRMLLDESGCEVDAKDFYGDTPMMLCAKRGYVDILQVDTSISHWPECMVQPKLFIH